MDDTFMDKLPNMCGPFIWYLLNHRKTRINSGRPYYVPDKVNDATNEYRKLNDTNRQFIEETLVEDGKSIITLNEVYALFKEWFKNGFPNGKLQTKQDIQCYFVKIWGPISKSYRWRGWRVRTIDDDIASGDVLVVESALTNKE